LIEASIAENTRRANRCDLAHFEAWGGELPADPAIVASYLAAHSETLSVATLVRRLATISKTHEARGLPNPCRSEIVRATLRGIKRTRGVAQREAKALLKEDLFRVLDAMGDGVKDARDAAELLRACGFCSRSRKFFSDYQDHSPHRHFFRAHPETGWTSLGSRAMSCDDGSAVVSRPPPR
jgi:hypothetical protein